MKFIRIKLLSLFLALVFVFIGCDSDEDENGPNIKNESIIGVWQMGKTTQYGLEFTNYGVAIWKHKPYMNSNLNYTYNGSILTVSGIVGSVSFSDGGKAIKISGFSDPSSFGKEGATGPYINGTYIKQ